MVGVDVPRNLFEFSPSKIAKTALVKSFCEKLFKNEKPLSVYFETFSLSSMGKKYYKETLKK